MSYRSWHVVSASHHVVSHRLVEYPPLSSSTFCCCYLDLQWICLYILTTFPEYVLFPIFNEWRSKIMFPCQLPHESLSHWSSRFFFSEHSPLHATFRSICMCTVCCGWLSHPFDSLSLVESSPSVTFICPFVQSQLPRPYQASLHCRKAQIPRFGTTMLNIQAKETQEKNQ